MADTHIKNPIEWSGAQLVQAGRNFGAAYRSLHHIQETIHSPAPTVKRIGIADLREALAAGAADFGAYRSDVFFLCVVYVVVGLVMAQFLLGHDMLPMLFPLASGFAILGPVAAVGLYEMSRRREQGAEVKWTNALDIIHEPGFPAIAMLGLMLIATFLVWLAVAWGIYYWTMGPELPTSGGAFLHDVFNTAAGTQLIVIGCGVGFLFALLAMSISIVSFPLLLDRDVGLDTAIKTSFRAVWSNPVTMAVWGLIVAAALVIGSIPLFTGLIVVLPILGHATWHLYRRVVGK
jgi:uncharacterized membrane protein